MIEFEYKDKEKELAKTCWAWHTVNSYDSAIKSGEVQTHTKNVTLQDAMMHYHRISAMATGANISRNMRRNRKASSAALKDGNAKPIRDLFMCPCPECKMPGEKIPREKPEFANSPPGLYCTKCDKAFLSKSIYYQTPIFSVGAGPSLNKNAVELKRVKGKYPIFSCDAAIRSLKYMGVTPDYVVTVEQDPMIMRAIDGVDTSGMTLIAVAGVSPEFRKAWKGDIYLFDSIYYNKRQEKIGKALLGDLGWACPGGNVSSMMLSLGIGVMANPIIFVGHDFSYTELRDYYPVAGPMSMIPVKQVYTTHDIFGKRVYTDSSLYSYKDWHEKAVMAMSQGQMVKFINATEGGIFGASYYDPQKYVRLSKWWREMKYRINTRIKEGIWPTPGDVQIGAYVGDRIKNMEFSTLKKTIDKYCPEANN